MAVVNPPGFLQNAGATHTALQFRNWLNGLLVPATSSTSLIARGGVNPALGNALSVTQSGSPAMSVVVKSGHAFIVGTQDSKQGVYAVMNDADVTLAIAASHATLNRIDIVVFKVEDSAFSGVVNTSSLAVVTGTPAGSPVAPAAPANSIILAQVSVVALDTAITNGEITDTRKWISYGIVAVESKTERDALITYDGLLVMRKDVTANAINMWNGASYTWVRRPTNDTVATSQTTTSTSYTDLSTVGPATTHEHGSTVKVTVTCRMRNSGVNLTRMSFAITGDNTVSAGDDRSLEIESTGWMRASASFMVTGLTTGSSTFTAKYKVAAGTGTFEDRQIIVQAW